MHFHAYVPSFLYILIYYCCWYFSDCTYLSLSLLLALVCSMAPKPNLIRPRTLCILGHLLPLTLHLPMSGSMMIKPEKTFRRTFVDKAFIRNATSFCQNFPTSFCQTFSTLTYPLSFTIGVGSHFVTSRSLVPP